MRALHITTKNFLDWYFNTGSEDEQRGLRLDLAHDVIEAFKKKETYTIQNLCNEANQYIIPVKYTEEYKNDDSEKLIEDLEEEIELILIP